jgi:hypothetical protein
VYDSEDVIDFVGGTLPVFTDGRADRVAACSCAIGRWKAEQLGLTFYDSLPGTSTADTKHDLIMGRFEK